MKENTKDFIYDLETIIEARISESDTDSYTYQLISSGPGLVAKKLVEESGELAVASLERPPKKEELLWEAADLMYHFLVLLRANNISLNDISNELESRHNK
jgi:phosphoribosyl-ATP pyrophosphohydrolase/phosphoribosyl-AMP cyclohydrolase